MDTCIANWSCFVDNTIARSQYLGILASDHCWQDNIIIDSEKMTILRFKILISSLVLRPSNINVQKLWYEHYGLSSFLLVTLMTTPINAICFATAYA
jgi:hypothetical protein